MVILWYLLELDTTIAYLVINNGIVKYLKDYHCTTIKHGQIW